MIDVSVRQEREDSSCCCYWWGQESISIPLICGQRLSCNNPHVQPYFLQSNMSLLARHLRNFRVRIHKQSVRTLALENILDDPGRNQFTTVNEFDEAGFLINNIHVQHPVILLPKHFLIWNTKSFEDIDVASLDMFSFIYPTLEMIIVGCGESSPQRLPRDVLEYFKYKGLVIEQMDSMNAAQTFNLLISEGRNVGAAILPLKPFPERKSGLEDEDFS